MISVITSIFEPTPMTRELVKRLAAYQAPLLVLGDQKGPTQYPLEGAELITLEDQLKMPFTLGAKLPTGHYARKNIGYLCAIQRQAECIYETDDDNMPQENWKRREEVVANVRVVDGCAGDALQWVNVYRYFTGDNIWPRGLPLDQIQVDVPSMQEAGMEVRAPIQQGLVNHSPDVDAIWRLVQDRPFRFEEGVSVYLSPGCWCPFNTQSTWWWPEAYALLYVPSFCTFRMCDIWKSFVAQRCLWELDCGLVFHAPEVHQERNPHDLMKDFNDEVPGYQGNHRLAQTLADLSLRPGRDNTIDNLVCCYEKLIAEGFFPDDEMTLVRAWAKDVEAYSR